MWRMDQNMFYVQKHMASLAVCPGLPLVRDRPLGVPPFVKFAYERPENHGNSGHLVEADDEYISEM